MSKNYVIIRVTQSTDINKDDIKSREIDAFNSGKRGSIILVGKKFSLGVSLPCVDVVFFLNNDTDVDLIYQRMFRGLTESKKKKVGILVDLNPYRTIKALLEYHKGSQNKKEDEESEMTDLKNLLENKIVYIDDDLIDTDDKNTHTYSDLYVVLKKVITQNFILTEIYKFKEEVNKYLYSGLYDAFAEDRKFFDDAQKTKNNKSKPIILHEKKEDLPSGTGIINNLDEGDGDSQEKKKKDPEILYKDNVKKLATLCEDIIIIYAVLYYDETTSFTSILQDMHKSKKKFSDKSNIDLDDDISKKYYIFMTKVSYLFKVNDSVICTKTNKIIESLLTRLEENNVSFTINNIFENMKKNIRSIGLDNPEKLYQFVEQHLAPKEYETRAFGEVFTPLWLVDEMLDQIEKSKPDIWKTPDIKILDPAAGIGNFPIKIYPRLMEGLKKKIPDPFERKKHILKNVLYSIELNPINCAILKRIMNCEGVKCNAWRGDFLSKKIQGKIKNIDFDLVIGNPPFNKAFSDHGAGASPLYHEFVLNMIDRCKIISFITPARWFSGGKGLDTFRKMMLSRRDIVSITTKKSNDVFGNKVDIKGEVCYFLKDIKHNGKTKLDNNMVNLSRFDILTRSECAGFIKKFDTKLMDIYVPSSYYGINTNDKRLKNSGRILCYVSTLKASNRKMYLDRYDLTEKNKFWKVIAASASGKGNDGFGFISVLKPLEIYSQSYISFKVESENQADSLASYLKCKFPNFMLSCRKMTQHINKNTCEWIPLPPLDRRWTDDKVYHHYSLTKKEIDVIEKSGIKWGK